MQIVLLTETNAKREIIRLIRDSQSIDIAVAWAGQNSISEQLTRQSRKLRHVVIGTHMYQTDPRVLRALMAFDSVRCMPPDGRLFHPKIYLFDLGASFVAVVGSHNLTTGAFEGRNIEASLLLTGDNDEPIFRKLIEYVSAEWRRARRIGGDFLFSYAQQHENNRKARKALGEFHPLRHPRFAPESDSPLRWSWAKYVREIKEKDFHHLEGRLQILEAAAKLFERRKSFGAMDRSERKAIAGTYGKIEDKVGGLDWGWFGNMFGHGDFKSLVNDEPEKLAKAIDQIPLRGTVSKENYHAFVKAFRLAFMAKAHKGGVPTASRLLTMKRPDIFAGVDDANKRKLCDAYGRAHSTLDLDNYWERIVVPVQLSLWWQSSCPDSEPMARIWKRRAALLDCIYYEP